MCLKQIASVHMLFFVAPGCVAVDLRVKNPMVALGLDNNTFPQSFADTDYTRDHLRCNLASDKRQALGT
jgi:hypothetical protein